MQNPNKFQRALFYPTYSLGYLNAELLCSIDANLSYCAVYRSNICDTGLCWKLIRCWQGTDLYGRPIKFRHFQSISPFSLFFLLASFIEKHWRVRDQWGLVLCVRSGHQRPVLISSMPHMGAQRNANYRLNVLKNHKFVAFMSSTTYIYNKMRSTYLHIK